MKTFTHTYPRKTRNDIKVPENSHCISAECWESKAVMQRNVLLREVSLSEGMGRRNAGETEQARTN
jgi:hypothetical protein